MNGWLPDERLKRFFILTLIFQVIYNDALALVSGIFDWNVYNMQGVCLKGPEFELNKISNFWFILFPIFLHYGGACYLDLKSYFVVKRNRNHENIAILDNIPFRSSMISTCLFISFLSGTTILTDFGRTFGSQQKFIRVFILVIVMQGFVFYIIVYNRQQPRRKLQCSLALVALL